MRTRIKICGITTPEDALLAAQLGADAIGMVFYPKSARAITLEKAQAISGVLPAFVATVALVVNATEKEIETICTQLKPAYLQFHGEETGEFCSQWHYPYIKAIRVKPGLPLDEKMQAHQNPWCKAILLDAYHPEQPGGTGTVFDWSAIPSPEKRYHPLILAGGLKASNITKAIEEVKPWAVDVSSGVEYEPGRKCPTSLKAFIQGVLHAAAVPLSR